MMQTESIIKPFWCVAANIVETRIYGPNGAWIRKGTKHFLPGAKVYILSAYWGMGAETVTVVGRHRGSHRFVTIDLPTNCLTNLRVQLIYSPFVINQIIAYWGTYSEVRKRNSKDYEDLGGSEDCKIVAEQRKEQFECVISRMQQEIEDKRDRATHVSRSDIE